MDALQFYAIAFVLIWTAALLFRNKLKIDIHGPLLMRRTKRMRCLIDRIANREFKFKFRRIHYDSKKEKIFRGPDAQPLKMSSVWKVLLSIGIPVAVITMVLMFVVLAYYLVLALKNMFFVHAANTVSAVGIAIPGVSIPGSGISVPLVYGLIALVTVMVVHEFGHGIIARAEGIKIKSIGVLMLAIIPGAFVEPDEKGVEKASKITKLRIYAAGSIFNMILAGVSILIMTLLSFGMLAAFDSQGVEVQNIVAKTPAATALPIGTIITGVNGHEITTIDSFSKSLNSTKPGDKVTFSTNKGEITVIAIKNPDNSSRGYIGVMTKSHSVTKQLFINKYGVLLPWVIYNLFWLFYWIGFLNLGIGTFNLMPLKPLDGGLIFEELLNYFTSSETANKATYIVSLASVFLVVGLIGISILPIIS